MVSRSADSSGHKRSSPLSINCSTAATIRSYSSSVSMALTTMRFASRAYFFGSTVRVALMISTPLSHFLVRHDAADEQDPSRKVHLRDKPALALKQFDELANRQVRIPNNGAQ